MPQSIGKKSKLFLYLILFILLTTQIKINKKIENKFVTQIEHFKVIGLSYENNLRVSESLNSLLFKNIFFIKKDDFYKILNKNPLIESFYIKKLYPNSIHIEIKQTNLLAVTNRDKKKFYIGSNGKLISTELVQSFNKKLPYVFTKSNYNNFIKLKEIIDESKFNFEEIESFYYFPSNRWDIKTKNGILIKLPEKNILETLKYVDLIKTDPKFKNNKIIDLRIVNQITVSYE